MSEEVITSYKGFDINWKCHDFQFALGETYLHEGKVEACMSGFHACEYPLDVFNYYGPACSKFAIVEQSGDLARHNGDSKVASRKISVKSEINIPGIIKAAVEFVTSRCNPANSEHATGDRSASSATGDRSASSATGDRSASSATGYRSASSATGYRSASSATGDRSASSATGDRSASLTTGTYSASEVTKPDSQAVAIGAGYENKARAATGCAIVLVNRDDDGKIVHIRASKVGENGIKPDTWYMLNENGEFVEVQK
ncbi:MAG: hypothetical protein KGI54_15340 [Pseudomonadota bacterium]|nr:hypothetical protein [Pseudomonadota bacterium]